MGSKKCGLMLKRGLAKGDLSYISPVAIVTAILGVTLFLLLVSVLAMISRINLLIRQLDSMLEHFKESDAKMENVAREVMGDTSSTGS